MQEYRQNLWSVARDIIDKQSIDDKKDEKIVEVYLENGDLVVVTEERKSRQ